MNQGLHNKYILARIRVLSDFLGEGRTRVLRVFDKTELKHLSRDNCWVKKNR